MFLANINISKKEFKNHNPPKLRILVRILPRESPSLMKWEFVQLV